MMDRGGATLAFTLVLTAVTVRADIECGTVTYNTLNSAGSSITVSRPNVCFGEYTCCGDPPNEQCCFSYSPAGIAAALWSMLCLIGAGVAAFMLVYVMFCRRMRPKVVIEEVAVPEPPKNLPMLPAPPIEQKVVVRPPPLPQPIKIIPVIRPPPPPLPPKIVFMEMPRPPRQPRQILHVQVPPLPRPETPPPPIVKLDLPPIPRPSTPPAPVIHVDAPVLPRIPTPPAPIVHVAAPELPVIPQAPAPIVHIEAPRLPRPETPPAPIIMIDPIQPLRPRTPPPPVVMMSPPPPPPSPPPPQVVYVDAPPQPQPERQVVYVDSPPPRQELVYVDSAPRQEVVYMDRPHSRKFRRIEVDPEPPRMIDTIELPEPMYSSHVGRSFRRTYEEPRAKIVELDRSPTVHRRTIIREESDHGTPVLMRKSQRATVVRDRGEDDEYGGGNGFVYRGIGRSTRRLGEPDTDDYYFH